MRPPAKAEPRRRVIPSETKKKSDGMFSLEAHPELQNGHARGGLQVRIVGSIEAYSRAIDEVLFGLGVEIRIEVVARGDGPVLLKARTAYRRGAIHEACVIS